MKLTKTNWKNLLEFLNLKDVEKRLFELNSNGLSYFASNFSLNIYQGKSTGEIRCSVKFNMLDEAVSLNDLLAASGKSTVFLYPENDSDIEFIAKTISDEIRIVIYASGLELDNLIVNSLKSRMDSSNEAMLRYTVSPVKLKADQAWKVKDFAEVIRLYESVVDNLSESEGKRLQFSRKALSKDKVEE